MWTSSFLWALGFSSLGAIVVAVAGAVLTEIGPWYDSLKKPGWKPPDWAFGPIWTTIFIMAAFAAALAWEAAPDGGAKTLVVAVLLVNGALNILWNIFFFKMRRPDYALIEVAVFWLSILALIVVLGSYSVTAGWLIVPYIIWVSAASLLNYQIVKLNRPFG
jgi:tryptophan-rich sensory protein